MKIFFVAIKKRLFLCLKGIHNKDYSVVKTFKLPRLTIRGFFVEKIETKNPDINRDFCIENVRFFRILIFDVID